LNVKEVKAKSILNRSKIFDYCLNPYTGCQTNCRYCYARGFMKRYSGHSEAWGDFVDVKVNAPELLAKQLERAKRGRIWISSVCDPYQPVEAKYKLTRRCLEKLGLEEVEVGFTITTDDEKVARLFEPGAPPVEKRLQALEEIRSKGIDTFVFVGPILPGNPERLVEQLDGITGRVLIDRMNYVSTIKEFYRRQGLEWAVTDEFFSEYRTRLTGELKKRKMDYEVFF
jgi:DNA repair photolyase